MKFPLCRLILAIETSVLRETILSGLTVLNQQLEIIEPEKLLAIEFSSCVLIYLETGDDVERLISTAERLWDRWGKTGEADLQFLCYPREDLMTDNEVFRLWAIGPEMTVIVPSWSPERLPEASVTALSFAKHYLHSIEQWELTKNTETGDMETRHG